MTTRTERGLRERALPILFSGDLPQAILDGMKSQTRRIVSPQPSSRFGLLGSPINGQWTDRGQIIRSPYGQPGSLLWVREAHYRFGHWEPEETTRTRSGRQKWRFVPHEDAGVLFEAPPAGFRKGRHHKDPSTPAWHKRLARFMPRALSRITLEVTEVRVERVQETSDADAMAEGVERSNDERWPWRNYEREGAPFVRASSSFMSLWDSINGERPGCSWEENPWVWAVSFRVVT